MSKLEDTISELRADLLPLSSREEFLAKCAQERIQVLTKAYDDKFDRLFKKLESHNFQSQDISTTLNSIQVFAETTSVLFSTFISNIDRINNKYFK